MPGAIVVTSIFSPTEAVAAFAAKAGYTVIVVGDKKTPRNWNSSGVSYLSVEAQASMSGTLVGLLPFNHYCRKMLGYLLAIEQGAKFIVDTDDDNIPKELWGFPEFEGVWDGLPDGLGHVNIYQLFTDQKIWPRGLPLDLIKHDFGLLSRLSRGKRRVGVWQALADDDPDVDAIYRLTSDLPCRFVRMDPVVLGEGTVAPFNSQNTMVRDELFELLYLPTSVTFRFTDILRGLVAQPIMWASGYRLGFLGATVSQQRNPHDYAADFASEVPMYLNVRRVVDVVQAAIDRELPVADNLHRSYVALLDARIVEKQEIETLEAWLEDVTAARIGQ